MTDTVSVCALASHGRIWVSPPSLLGRWNNAVSCYVTVSTTPQTFENSKGRDASTQERNSQGEDPRTLVENSKGGNVSTHQQKARERTRDPLKHQLKGGGFRKKRKQKTWKRKRKKKKEIVKHRRNLWWTEAQSTICTNSEGCSSKNEALLEAVLKKTRTTKPPWLIACDAWARKISKKTLWFRKDKMHVIAPGRVSTCRSKKTKGEWVEKVYDYACSSLFGKKFRHEGDRRFRIKATQSGHLCSRKRKGQT